LPVTFALTALGSHRPVSVTRTPPRAPILPPTGARARLPDQSSTFRVGRLCSTETKIHADRLMRGPYRSSPSPSRGVGSATNGARTGGFCFPHQIGLRVNPVDFARKLCPDWRCINWGMFAPSLLQIVSSPKANQEPNHVVELVAIGAWQVYHLWGPGVGSVSSSWCGEGGSGSCAKVGPPVYWQFLARAPSLPWSRRISWPARLDH
jgi:hypothetical protein